MTKVVYNDGTHSVYHEDDEVKVDNGVVKKAKKITALDTIGGRSIFIVEKEKVEGKTAVCNLASVNLSKVNTKEEIEECVPVAMRMLDNVIDLNFYPHAKVKRTNMLSRSVGLGVMGEAQMLAESGISWGSYEHLAKIDEVMEAISYNAIYASSNLAIEKGIYPEFEGSNWSKGIFPIDVANEKAKELVKRGGLFDSHTYDWDELRANVKENGMRNGCLMEITLTGSISILF